VIAMPPTRVSDAVARKIPRSILEPLNERRIM
jgi:hypothetical protein